MFFSRKPRGMAHGNIVLLDPRADEADLKHELIHVKQWMQGPLIYPFLSFLNHSNMVTKTINMKKRYIELLGAGRYEGN